MRTMLFEKEIFSENQFLTTIKGVRISIKREDKLHPIVSGNKYRKLKYNLLFAKEKGYENILSFGGAFSNHLSALAWAGNHFNFKTIGVVRGEEWKNKIEKSATLRFCIEQRMQLHFVSRKEYRQKHTEDFKKKICNLFNNAYLLPEGGTNELAIKGCKEIITNKEKEYDTICCSVGTGGTFSGLILGKHSHQNAIGFNALKNKEVEADIKYWTKQELVEINHDYTFGGYAKTNNELINFINDFYQKYQIKLDPIYTGKMFFGIFDLLKKNRGNFGTNILVIHSGGLQGIEGINQRNRSKKCATINY